jgi:hypothetical protein
MGNAAALTPSVIAYLDVLQQLTEDDGFYRHTTASMHTCAIDDPIVMLHHARREGLCSTPADHRLHDLAVADVRKHRSTFFCQAEIERRMTDADGACPMCGFEIVFQSGEDSNGYRGMMMRCQHSGGHVVKPADIESYLRQPRSWQGRNWPWAYMQGTAIPVKDGEPIVPHDGSRTPCPGCLEMEAQEQMEKALFKLISSAGLEAFTKQGWSSPVSAYICDWPTHACTSHDKQPCDRVYMHVKRDVQDAQGTYGYSKEVRLNGAGLKLYIKGASAGRGRQVSFGMRVGGDQVHDYPGFQDFAHSLFNELGVPTETA